MATSKLEQLKIEREPEVKPRPPHRFMLVTVAVLVIATIVWWFKPVAAVEVRVALAREISSQVANTILNASGYVTARRQATVSSKFTGKVMEVLIEEGAKVDKNQVLARLDDANVRASYALARAQLKSAEASRKETEALLDEARANYTRAQQLNERGLASAAELDRTRAVAESLAAQSERKQADIQVADKQIDIYRQQLEDTIIRAPFAGVVVAKNAQPGEMISPISAGGGFTRTGIGTIVDMSSLEIDIDVNEAYIKRVESGQRAVATLDAYPNWQIPCHVIAIIPTADRQRATVGVRVGFDRLDSRILPDMGVKVAFQHAAGSSLNQTGVLVPQAAVKQANGKDFVLVVSANVVERRVIATGEERGTEVLVTAGLTGGEKVILNAPSSLHDGDHVKETKG